MPIGIYPAYSQKPTLQRFSSRGPASNQAMAALGEQYPVLKTMYDLIDIPTPTPNPHHGEAALTQRNFQRLRDYIINYFKQLGVTDIQQDQWGSLIMRIPGTPGLENAQPLLLTTHIDIVPGDAEHPAHPIYRTYQVEEGRAFIGTDGQTTLGADAKAGVAVLMDTVKNLLASGKPHLPLEILLGGDEEGDCESLKQLDTRQFKARETIVLDAFEPLRVITGTASAVDIGVHVNGVQGGHSGNDIGKPTHQLNASMILVDVLGRLKSGVIRYAPEYGNIPWISKNLGPLKGGVAANAIPSEASANYLLRSFDAASQEAERQHMQQILDERQAFYRQQQPNVNLSLNWHEEYPPWVGNQKSPFPHLCAQAAQSAGFNHPDIGLWHAATQASVLANRRNQTGEQFDAVVIGPRIEGAHSKDERVEAASVVDLDRWLAEIIDVMTERSKAV